MELGEAKGRTNLVEVEYQCLNCKHTQVLRFNEGEPHIQILCCTACRAGFGVELEEQLNKRIGMIPMRYVGV